MAEESGQVTEGTSKAKAGKHLQFITSGDICKSKSRGLNLWQQTL